MAGSLLKLTHVPSRGRALVASQALLPGQILLQESPLLLYLDAQMASSSVMCFHCSRPNFNLISPDFNAVCPSCQVAAFCSPACACAASSSTHTPFVCKALSLLVLCTLDVEIQTRARYLIAAYNLAMVSPEAFEQLLSLEGEGTVDEKVHLVHTFLSEAIRSWQLECQELPSWPAEFVASLLAKDHRNAFGLSTLSADLSHRQNRAYAIYAQASFFNHDCLPNACRFDYIDKPGVGNADIIIRSLHGISEGAEVCLSYFPINWRLAERKQRLKEDYGFECTCERCKVEDSWSDDDGDDDITQEADDISLEEESGSLEGDEDMGSTEAEVMEADLEAQGSFPHAIFFVKYLCPVEGCGGTLAPLPPTEDGPSSYMECNVCGQLRSEEAFLEEIEQHKVSS